MINTGGKAMNQRVIASLGFAALLLVGRSYATEYEITVEVDETTAGDLEMVEDFLFTSNEEGVPSQSLRRLVMAGVGELAAAADQRFDASGNLLLDDGSTAQFLEEDLLKVRKKICSRKDVDGQCGNATITFDCKLLSKTNPHRKCQPTSVLVCPTAGGHISLNVPPGTGKGGVDVCPPNSGGCKSCIKK
jgi:hypothetical protein